MAQDCAGQSLSNCTAQGCVIEGGICRKPQCSYTNAAVCITSSVTVNGQQVMPCSWQTRVDINDTVRQSCVYSLTTTALGTLAAAASLDVASCPETSTPTMGPVIGILVTVLVLLLAGLGWIIHRQRQLNPAVHSFAKSDLDRPLNDGDEMSDL